MAAVFSDFEKMPESSEPLTICCKSVGTELKTLLSKSDGVLRQHVKDLMLFNLI